MTYETQRKTQCKPNPALQHLSLIFLICLKILNLHKAFIIDNAYCVTTHNTQGCNQGVTSNVNIANKYNKAQQNVKLGLIIKKYTWLPH